MKPKLTGLLAAAAILMSMTGSSMAVVSSDQARSANARNPADTPMQAPTGGDANSKSPQSPGSGTTLGQGAGNTGAPLGYSKGPGESSSVGKSR